MDIKISEQDLCENGSKSDPRQDDRYEAEEEGVSPLICISSGNTTSNNNINPLRKSSSEETLNVNEMTIANNPDKIVNNKKKQRLYWADCARIFSIVCIILLHSSGHVYEVNLLKEKGKKWKLICLYNCITRFGVPMFVLLSGTFILNPSKPLSFKKLFRHNILRLATAFTFWSTANTLLDIYLYKKHPISDFFKLFFVGEEYLWFIFMIIGCYLIAPILRLFSDDVFLARYFLGLCVFWGSFVPTLKNILTTYEFDDVESELDTWTSRWHYTFTLEFVGYFVAGYHIIKYVNIKSMAVRLFLYVLAVLDVLLMYKLTSHAEEKSKKYSKEFRDNYTLTVAFYAIVLFIFFKHEIGRIHFSGLAVKIITKISALTFGMYLTHLIIKGLFVHYIYIDREKLLGIKLSPGVGCLVLWVIVTVTSLAASYIISLIPILNKYIV